MGKVYLDYAAATPMRPEVLEGMAPYFSEKFHNPSATYLSSRATRLELNQYRAKAASLIGARPAEIIFTSGATEANNLAILGVSNQFPGSNVIVSAIEHESVMAPALSIGALRIPVKQSGVMEMDKLSDLLDDKTVLVSIMLVNNEIGSIQPIKEIADLINNERAHRAKLKNRLPIYLHTDAAQAGNYFDLSTSRLGVDLMSINSGKLYGPKGVGLLYIRAGTKLKPLILGGGQEYGVRSGTENLALIAGFTAAFQASAKTRKEEHRRVKGIREFFENELVDLFPQVTINGDKHRSPHICSVSFPGVDNEILMMQLDELGIECGLGSACSAAGGESSHTLLAIDLNDQQARSTLRFSFGAQTIKKDIEKTIHVLKQLLNPS